MESSILTGQVLVHKPAPGLLVTRQTSPALSGDLGNALMPLLWSNRALTAWHGHQISVVVVTPEVICRKPCHYCRECHEGTHKHQDRQGSYPPEEGLVPMRPCQHQWLLLTRISIITVRRVFPRRIFV